MYAEYAFLEKTGQLRFTPPIQVFYAMQQAINEFFMEGEENRINRYHHNFRILVEGLQDLGFDCLIPDECQSKLLVFMKYSKALPFKKWHDYLYAQGITIYPSQLPIENSIRFACMGALEVSDIKVFLEKFKEMLVTQAH